MVGVAVNPVDVQLVLGSRGRGYMLGLERGDRRILDRKDEETLCCLVKEPFLGLMDVDMKPSLSSCLFVLTLVRSGL